MTKRHRLTSERFTSAPRKSTCALDRSMNQRADHAIEPTAASVPFAAKHAARLGRTRSIRMRAPLRSNVILGAAVLLLGFKVWGIDQRVRLETATGTLHGTLDLPNGAASCPAVVIIAGSGPTDRDGNQAALKNDSLK